MKFLNLFLVMTSTFLAFLAQAHTNSGLQNSAFVILRDPDLSRESFSYYSPEVKSQIKSLAEREGGHKKFLNDYLKLLKIALNEDYFVKSKVNTQTGRLSLPVDFAAESLSDQEWNEFSRKLVSELANLDHSSKYVQEYLRVLSFGWGNFQIYFNFTRSLRSFEQRESFFNQFQGRQLQLLGLLYQAGLLENLNSQISNAIQLELGALQQARTAGLEFGDAQRIPHEFMFGGKLTEVFSSAALLIKARSIYSCNFIFGN